LPKITPAPASSAIDWGQIVALYNLLALARREPKPLPEAASGRPAGRNPAGNEF